MAKKLFSIKEKVDSSAVPFFEYLGNTLSKEVFCKLNELSNLTSVYIFSGIIRNYFLKIKDIRDIDIILEDKIDVEKVFVGYEIKVNSFGGYKISNGEMIIDLWYMEHTWALEFQKTFDFELNKHIPGTAFFNFSSILFSFNKKSFFYTNHFLRFLRDKKIDLVFKPNANYSLCIINTVYYSKKYRLGVTEKLKNHLKYLHNYRTNKQYERIQLKHFGEVLFSNEVIEKEIFEM